MLSRILAVCLLASAEAFVANAPLPLQNAARAPAPACQFGTGNADGNGFDEKGNPNFFLSPIAGGSKVCAWPPMSQRHVAAPLQFY